MVDKLPTKVGWKKSSYLQYLFCGRKYNLYFRRLLLNFNEKLINLRKSKGLSQEELGNELKVSRQTISKWESCQSYPDFQRLVLLSDFFGLTLDELVRDIDVQEVREKNLNNEKLSSIYDDINEGKKFIRLCYIIGTGVLIFFSLIVLYGVFFPK